MCLYETKSGLQHSRLFGHAEGIAITKLVFDAQNSLLSSADSSGRVISHRLARSNDSWEVVEALFDYRTNINIDQILSDEGHTHLLIASSDTDLLCSITPSSSTIVASISSEDRRSYRWGAHPLHKDQLILVTDCVAHIYQWSTLERLTTPEGILLEGSMIPELLIRSIAPCFAANAISMAFGESSGSRSKSKLLLWESSDFTAHSKKAAPVPRYQYLADQVEFLIGSYGQRLVFLHSTGWICSTDSRISSADHYVRHFFLPADWLTTDADLMIEVTRKGDIIFVKRDEVAVIKRGLDATEHRSNAMVRKRPTLEPQSSLSD